MTGQRLGRIASAMAALLLAGGAIGRASAVQDSPQQQEKSPAAEIVLKFPMGRSLGRLHIFTETGPGRDVDAMGEVRVPAGARMTLTLSQAAGDDLSPLAGPVKQGLTQLYCRNLVLAPAAFEQLSKMDGLESLQFLSAEVTDADLARLAQLDSLRKLSFFGASISDAGVASLERLPMERLHLFGTKVTDRVWQTVAKLKTLKDLRLADKTISDAGFKYLKELPNLEHLMLDNLDEVSDEAMRHLGRLKNLKRVSFSSMGIRLNEVALAELAKIESLEFLDLDNAKVPEDVLARLAPLKKLKLLRLPSAVTDEDLASIGAFTELQNLGCSCDGVTEAGMAEIAKLPKLTFLNLSCDRVGDAGMRALAGATTLKGLFVQHCEVGDDGLAALAPLESLNWLLIRSTNITTDGLRHLSKLSALKSLSLADLAGGEAGLEHLADLRQLESLNVEVDSDSPALAESELEHLVGLTRLARLQLEGFALSDVGAEHVAAIDSLESFQYLADDSQMTNAALAEFAAMPKLQQLWVRGNFTDDGLNALATSQSLRAVQVESDWLSQDAIARLRRVMDVDVPVRYRIPNSAEKLFQRGGALVPELTAARAEAGRELTRVLLVFGDPDGAATKRLLRILRHPDVDAALAHFSPVGVRPDEAEELRKLLGMGVEALGEIEPPALVVVDEAGRALVDEKLAIPADQQFLDPKPLLEFLGRHQRLVDADGLLAVAIQRARAESKRVMLLQTSGRDWRCDRLWELINKYAAFFSAEYVIVPLDAERFQNGAAVVARYRPAGQMLPWIAILDASGATLITSDGPAGALGFPSDDARIAYFMHMLNSTVQRAAPEQLQQIGEDLEQRIRRN